MATCFHPKQMLPIASFLNKFGFDDSMRFGSLVALNYKNVYAQKNGPQARAVSYFTFSRISRILFVVRFHFDDLS